MPTPDATGAPIDRPEPPRRSLLVVEDDPELSFALERNLAAAGFNVHMAHSADAAHVLLATLPIDVLLTDLRLAEGDGLELIRAASRSPRAPRPILMSAFATAKDYIEATDLGVVSVLCKPFSRRELLAAVEQAIECRTGFRGSVHGLSLVDVLQMFHFSRRSVTINVGGSPAGQIHMRDGELIHAQAGPIVGQRALRMLLDRGDGYLRTTALDARVQRSIDEDFHLTLMDSLRLNDEEHSTDERRADPEPARPTELPDLWEAAYSKLIGFREGALAIAVSLSSRAPIPLRGTTSAPEWIAPSVEWVEAARAIRPDRRAGSFDCIRDDLALAFVWDADRDFVVTIADVLRGDQTAAWFRMQVATLARHLVGRTE